MIPVRTPAPRPVVNTNTNFVPPTTPYGTPGNGPANANANAPGAFSSFNLAGVNGPSAPPPSVAATIANGTPANIGGRTTPPTPGNSPGISQPVNFQGGAGKFGSPQQGTPGMMNTGGGKGTAPTVGAGKGV